MIFLCSLAIHQEPLLRSMIMVKSWAFRASATRPLEDTRPSMPCFGKMAPLRIFIQIRQPRGGIRRRQSINEAM